ncbi:MAG: hypothetical protein AAFP92_07630 [Bacteroidota bacterium]
MLFLFCPTVYYAQQPRDIRDWMNNEDIEFEIIRISANLFTRPPSPSKYIVEVSLSDKKLNEASVFTTTEWLTLLDDPTTDWAANLVLYAMSEKDAFLYVNLTEKDWRLVRREEDIKYWYWYLMEGKKQIEKR